MLNVSFFLLEQRIPNIENSSEKKKAIEDLIRYEIKKTNVADEDIGSRSNLNLVASDEQDQPEERDQPEESTEKNIDLINVECYTQFGKRQRMEFSFDDNLLIQNHLANWIQGNRAINKVEFSNDVNSIPELKEIVKNIGISKLIVKVRTERKKL